MRRLFKPKNYKKVKKFLKKWLTVVKRYVKISV